MAKPDWEAIETAYRAGVMSLREIASHHGISEGAIRKRAKRDDWSRDLNARIQQKADDLVRKQEVRKTVRTKTELTERVLIEATAEVIASVRMEHRGDIRRARELTNTLFDELGAQCADVFPATQVVLELKKPIAQPFKYFLCLLNLRLPSGPVDEAFPALFPRLVIVVQQPNCQNQRGNQADRGFKERSIKQTPCDEDCAEPHHRPGVFESAADCRLRRYRAGGGSQ